MSGDERASKWEIFFWEGSLGGKIASREAEFFFYGCQPLPPLIRGLNLTCFTIKTFQAVITLNTVSTQEHSWLKKYFSVSLKDIRYLCIHDGVCVHMRA